MADNKLKKGEKLSVALQELAAGDTLEVPFRQYSEASIRVAAYKHSKDSGIRLRVNVLRNDRALVTRDDDGKDA